MYVVVWYTICANYIALVGSNARRCLQRGVNIQNQGEKRKRIILKEIKNVKKL
jgi:hypothetical protein